MAQLIEHLRPLIGTSIANTSSNARRADSDSCGHATKCNEMNAKFAKGKSVCAHPMRRSRCDWLHLTHRLFKWLNGKNNNSNKNQWIYLPNRRPRCKSSSKNANIERVYCFCFTNFHPHTIHLIDLKRCGWIETQWNWIYGEIRRRKIEEMIVPKKEKNMHIHYIPIFNEPRKFGKSFNLSIHKI